MAPYIAIVLSVVAVCKAYPRCEGLDYLGIIVGLLALLTTFVVGWQILNVIQFERRAKELMEKETEKVLNDFMIVMSGILQVNTDNSQLVGGCAYLVDNVFKGLEKVNGCRSPMKEIVTNRFLSLILQFLTDFGGEELQIYEKEMKGYLEILSGLPYTPMIATIQERIEKAKKIPKPDKVDNYLNSMREDDVINAVDNELSI